MCQHPEVADVLRHLQRYDRSAPSVVFPLAREVRMNRYCIPAGYQPHNQPAHWDDTELRGDEYQCEVYAFARRVMESRGLRSVLDIGCGNGYQLVAYLGEFDTVGVEVEPSLSFLRRTYPNRLWLESGEASESFVWRSQRDSFDLILCANVIEHIKEPDAFMNAISALESRFVLFSTPDREILAANPPWHAPMLGTTLQSGSRAGVETRGVPSIPRPILLGNRELTLFGAVRMPASPLSRHDA